MKWLQTPLCRGSERTHASAGHRSSHACTHLAMGCSLETICIQGSVQPCCVFLISQRHVLQAEARKGTLTTKGRRRLIFISYLLHCQGLTGSFLDKSLRNFYASLYHSVRAFITLGLYRISQLSFSATQVVSGKSVGGGSGCSGHKVVFYFCCHTMRWPGLEGLGSNLQIPAQAAPAKPLSLPKQEHKNLPGLPANICLAFKHSGCAILLSRG